ncbi:MAG: serine/threonine protein kinase [Deltaproteobacteria bacterium]|nr:serine/threonine protein kinase [Deltaproteobacteria bacterium]
MSVRRRDPSDLIGQTIADRYVLESILGEGGAATVYAATDTRLGGECAVKVLNHPHPIAARRMDREVRVVASMQHPNLCHVTDYGRIDAGTPFMVMERLVGQALGDRLLEQADAPEAGRVKPRTQLPIAEAVEIAKQVLSVLHVAHQRSYVHRDIKPANIFLVDVPGRPPLVKVLDFGVASADYEQGLTDRGQIVGTPAYMSPEQAAAYPDIDGRTDIYACAVVLYQCLTGVQPFQSEKALETLDRIIRGGATPVSALRPDVPAEVSRAVERGMRVEREARFATALEMIEALDGKIATSPHETWEAATSNLGQIDAEQVFDDVTSRIPPIAPPRRK